MGNTTCCSGDDKRQREWEEWDDAGGGAGGPRRFRLGLDGAAEAFEGGGDAEAPTPYRSQMSLPPENPGDPASWRRYNPQARRESFGLRGKLIGGRFRVEETIGKGSTSVCYCVVDRAGLRYAAKALDKRRLQMMGGAVLKQFNREIYVLRALANEPRSRHHPSLIRLRHIFETRSKLYVITELARGGELYDHLSAAPQGRLCEAEAGIVIRDLCSGVAFLHARGIIHRDLKLENVLLSVPAREAWIGAVGGPRARGSVRGGPGGPHGRSSRIRSGGSGDVRAPCPGNHFPCLPGLVRIIDFGLASVLSLTGGRAATLLGTTGYIAPEILLPNQDRSRSRKSKRADMQLQQQQQEQRQEEQRRLEEQQQQQQRQPTQKQGYDAGVDSWSIGVMLFIMLCGVLPFDQRGQYEIAVQTAQAIDAEEEVQGEESKTAVAIAAAAKAREEAKGRYALRFPSWASTLSPAATDLLRRLLSIDPSGRPTPAEVLLHPFVAAATDSSLYRPAFAAFEKARKERDKEQEGSNLQEWDMSQEGELRGDTIHEDATYRRHRLSSGTGGTGQD